MLGAGIPRSYWCLRFLGLRGPGAIHYDHVDFECISCGFEVQGLGVWRGFLDSECRGFWSVLDDKVARTSLLIRVHGLGLGIEGCRLDT